MKNKYKIMTLKELKTKTLEEILKEKDICLLVLKEDIYQKIVERIGVLSEEEKDQLKDVILEGIKEMLILQKKTEKEMDTITNNTIDEMKIMYKRLKKVAYNDLETKDKTESKREADNLINLL